MDLRDVLALRSFALLIVALLVVVRGSAAEGGWVEEAYLKAYPNVSSSTGTAGALFGSAVAVDETGLWMVVGAPGEDDNTGAVYLYTRNEQFSQRNDSGWTVIERIIPPDTNGSSTDGISFGFSVDISTGGTTAACEHCGTAFCPPKIVIGAPKESNAAPGVAQFYRDYPTESCDVVDFDYDACHIVPDLADTGEGEIEASGAAYIYHVDGFAHVHLNSYIKAESPAAGDDFGNAVALAVQELEGFSAGSTTCDAVLQQTEWIVVVAAHHDSSNATGATAEWPPNSNAASSSVTSSGAAYVYSGNGIGYNGYGQGPGCALDGFLKAPNAEENDYFGDSVDISGTTIVCGASGEDSGAGEVVNADSHNDMDDNSANFAGAAYAFVRSTEDGGAAQQRWQHQSYFKAVNSGEDDYFGASVAIDDDTIIVGAYGEASCCAGGTHNDDRQDSGAAYIFTRSGDEWAFDVDTQYLKAANPGSQDYFGRAVSVSGDTVVIGCYEEDSEQMYISNGGVEAAAVDNSREQSGAAFVFDLVNDDGDGGGEWVLSAYLKASNAGANDHFGASVDVENGFIVVGAAREDSDAIGVTDTADGDPEDNNMLDAGAAYVIHYSTEAVVDSVDTSGDSDDGSPSSDSNNAVKYGAGIGVPLGLGLACLCGYVIARRRGGRLDLKALLAHPGKKQQQRSLEMPEILSTGGDEDGERGEWVANPAGGK